MTECYTRPMEAEELKEFFKHIEEDFAPGEYAPYEVLYHQLQNGIQEGIVFCEETRKLAYSICGAGNNNGYVLISLLAVLPEWRGKGIGSEFLKAIGAMYKEKQGIIVEVEKPGLSETQEEHASRKQRIEFYEKAGFYMIPGVDYSIWDVPMHLMALPVRAFEETINKEIGQIIYQIYFQLMGKRFIHKMQIRVTNN